MSKFNLPSKTVNDFGEEPVFPHNINLLLSKYLIHTNEINKMKEEVFLYLSKDSRVLDEIVGKIEKAKTKEKNEILKSLRKYEIFLTRLIGEKLSDILRDTSKKDVAKIISKIYSFKVSREKLRKELFNFSTEMLNKCNSRMKNIATKTIQIKAASRIVVGLGATSVLETSIKLHHIYGIPYIPSSAIKGMLRAYKMWELSGWDEELYKAIESAIEIYDTCDNPEIEFSEKLKELNDVDIKEKIDKILSIFGSQSKRGSLIIFDAFPEKFSDFDIDIMNPHYPEYYQEDKYPGDWQNPVPIKFLTIPEDTPFNFYFRNTEGYASLKDDLKNALKTLGIGAKTALGYGVFDV